MTKTAETVPFQAETRELLSLVVHSLYTNREIFLRELISNASDALDKLRFEALTRPELLAGADAEELSIRLECDPDERTVRVVDEGIGMTRDEVVANLGTIASSGTKRFLASLKERGAEATGAPELIGQFGVGFYSAFMVADEVVVVTRHADAETGVVWSSNGEGEYTLEEADGVPRGTSVTLHLRAPESEDDEGWQEFADARVLRGLVTRYSDFIEHPIRMRPLEGDEDAALETINSQRPLWTRPRADVDAEEYTEFYKHLTHDWHDPLLNVHFRAEGTLEYTALLFVPRERPVDLFDPRQLTARVQLYVRRVFVLSDCTELLPSWLRFVRGVVDSADLPLNVSRETLQHQRQLGRMRERLVSKLLDELERTKEHRPEDFTTFWQAFGVVIKEGIAQDVERRERLAALAVFPTSAGDEPVSLADYIERKPVSQDAIWYLLARDRVAAERSPHLETFRAKGIEVLYLVDPIDEFVVQALHEFEGTALKAVDRGELDLGDEADDDDTADDHEPLLAALRESLGDAVSDVRTTRRLTDSPAVLVAGAADLPPQLRRMMEETGHAPPPLARTLELNASHPLVERLGALRADGGEAFDEAAELILSLARVAEGEPLEDPARFATLVTRLATPLDDQGRSE